MDFYELRHFCGGCLLCKPHKLTANVKADRARRKLDAMRREAAAG